MSQKTVLRFQRTMNSYVCTWLFLVSVLYVHPIRSRQYKILVSALQPMGMASRIAEVSSMLMCF
jgi:hypothetical protein